MGFFGWMFWFVALFFVMSLLRRHRCGPRHEPRERPGEMAEQRSYIESLESRVEYLEERLDFTERLLASRPAGTPQRS